MAATMKKSDVKYQCDDLAKVDWKRIKALVGRAVPPLAEKEVKDTTKKAKAGKYKAPYLKVGLVDGKLVLRLKDGSKHISDVVLAEGDGNGGSGTATLSRSEQAEVDAYRKAKEDLPGATKDYLNDFLKQLDTAKDKAAEIKEKAAAVANMPVGNERALIDVTTLRQDIEQMSANLSKTLKDDVKVALMDPHRNGQFAKAPACIQGTERKDLLTLASKCWTAANANYGRMEGVIKQLDSLAKLARTLETKAQSRASDQLGKREAELAALTQTAKDLGDELDDVKSLFLAANSAPNFVKFVENKTEMAKDPNSTLETKHALINQVLGQAKLIKGRTKDIHSKLESIQKQASGAVSDLDKQLQKDKQFKPLIKQLAETSKAAAKAKKDWDKDVVTALKGFDKLKKLVGT